MRIKEISVERFSFTCPGCAHSWVVDYDVQHVDAGRGQQHDYFFRDGRSSMDPTATGAVPCPICRRLNVKVTLSGRRVTPAFDQQERISAPARPSAQLRAQRESAPPLPADVTKPIGRLLQHRR
jgi:hypothetical protein